jgi:carbonic anhydrase
MTTTQLRTSAHCTLPKDLPIRPSTRCWPAWRWCGTCCCLVLLTSLANQALANEHPEAAPVAHGVAPKPPASAASAAKAIADQVREAVKAGVQPNKDVTVGNGKEKKFITLPVRTSGASAEAPAKTAIGDHSAAPVAEKLRKSSTNVINPLTSRQYIRSKADALAGHEPSHDVAGAVDALQHSGEVHWSYEGENGPQAWGTLKPDFNACAVGKRQSPINIEESNTLQGPAEPLQFNYQLSSGTVVNNGHTIQVDLFGDNSLTVRNSVYKLLQFHFHTPSEERVNQQGFAMVAHLVHRNIEGQLAVVSVLLDPGVANALINKVWTHMPLDANDRVRMPAGIIDMNELLPKDQRYYQFMGSLTTPPCTEGVLWMVLKQPTTLSPAQIKLFSQLFPNNARPVQPLNGRAVRDAQ